MPWIMLTLAAVGAGLWLIYRRLRPCRPCERRIVVFSPDLADWEAERIVRRMGARLVKQLPLVHGAVCEFRNPKVATALSAHSQVHRVDDDLTVSAYPCTRPLTLRPKAVPPQPPETLPWGVARIFAPAVWQGSPPDEGGGVDVAVLDTGADLTHPDLSPNLAAGVNILDPRRPPRDDNGHGTHVSGIVAAALNQLGVVGVAPKARIRPVKVLDRDGGGSLSDIVAGLDWCVRNGIRVANLSLGSPQGNATFADAVARASSAGVVLVAAAGNEGPYPETVGYPARYPQVIAVAATTQQDVVAEYSSRGPEVDLAAPGDQITSTWPGGEYRESSGTSMAAPHVSGVVALMLAEEPRLFPAQVKARLQEGAKPLAAEPPEAQGAGLVDARAILRH